MGWSLCSYAYVLPAKQILAFMSDHVGRHGTLILLQKTVLYDQSLEGGMQELEETLYFKSPRMFRTEISTSVLEKVQVVGPGGALTMIDGKIIGESEGPFDHYKDPFLYGEPEYLADELAHLGIDLETVSLGRFKDKIAFVIGAKSFNQPTSQVWIEKESFQPIRFILGGEDETSVREIEYSDYQNVGKGKSFPKRILFYEDGNLVRMQVLQRFDLDADITDDLFDVAYLKSLYEPVAPPPPPETELDEVKKTIQDFRKIFE
jgi:hypothetical protein